MRCQLDEALEVYTEATALAKDQREIEHIVLYEKGKLASKRVSLACENGKPVSSLHHSM